MKLHTPVTRKCTADLAADSSRNPKLTGNDRGDRLDIADATCEFCRQGDTKQHEATIKEWNKWYIKSCVQVTLIVVHASDSNLNHQCNTTVIPYQF